jgi:hypothetical protein
MATKNQTINSVSVKNVFIIDTISLEFKIAHKNKYQSFVLLNKKSFMSFGDKHNSDNGDL